MTDKLKSNMDLEPGTRPGPHAERGHPRTPVPSSPHRRPVSPANLDPGGVCHFSRPRGQSLGSLLSSRIWPSKTKGASSQQGEPEALLDLILESQCQRLEDQRASLSLLPDPEPAALCGACSPDQPLVPTLDFYCMLIRYQSDRMEDQRCPLPDLKDIPVVVPEGQEDFLNLVQRVQSKRMNDQRVSALLGESENFQEDEG